MACIADSRSFQEVQHLSAFQASIRILPSLIVGIILAITTGIFVNRVPAIWIASVTSILTAGAPLLMALVRPEWPYWYNAFFAQLLQPISGDVLFTVGLIIVSDVFPERTQGLAGAVFSVSSQFGNSIGLAITQVISTAVTMQAPNTDKKSPEALFLGYQASYWTMFAWMLVCFFVGVYGLRSTGRIGLKRN